MRLKRIIKLDNESHVICECEFCGYVYMGYVESISDDSELICPSCGKSTKGNIRRRFRGLRRRNGKKGNLDKGEM